MRPRIVVALIVAGLLCAGCPNTGRGGHRNVQPGAPCATAGAQGTTAGGTPMVCARAGDDVLRWKRA
jgi:predicted small secreted protein